ncbi:MAG TPA: hypothetical protein VMH77_09795 [Steroidobacteraceae bacterium]|nr:hypothetical protein [Steroidobacteraceae bacterium]
MLLVAPLLLAGCAVDLAAAMDPGPSPPERPRVEYDCQGVRLTVEYSVDGSRALLTWPDGSDVVKWHRARSGVLDYRGDHSALHIDKDVVWGREGSPPRFCKEWQPH